MARHGVATVGDLPEDIRPKRPTQQTSANLLRRLQRMEREEAAVPAAIVDELDEMYEVATNLVNNLVLQYKAKVKKAEETGEDVVLLTQRDGDDHKSRYPACWHRAVAARVAGAVPGLIIEYGEYDAEV
jgi:hypothetical protein